MLEFERTGKIAIIAVSAEGALVGNHIQKTLPNCVLYCSKETPTPTKIYEGTLKNFVGSLWSNHAAIIFVMASGIAVRSIAPWVESKLSDPAVVVVDDSARFAISLLSGHEGHANRLTEIVSEILGSMPVVTTGTESQKRIIVGIGCRRGIPKETILAAISASLEKSNKSVTDIYALATIDIKAHEEGILAAARELGVPLRVIPKARIRHLQNALNTSNNNSSFVEDNIGVAAVCEPAALLASHHSQILLNKQASNGVTIAVAQDTFGAWE